jgi:hypothetical protein
MTAQTSRVAHDLRNEIATHSRQIERYATLRGKNKRILVKEGKLEGM